MNRTSIVAQYRYWKFTLAVDELPEVDETNSGFESTHRSSLYTTYKYFTGLLSPVDRLNLGRTTRIFVVFLSRIVYSANTSWHWLRDGFHVACFD